MRFSSSRGVISPSFFTGAAFRLPSSSGENNSTTGLGVVIRFGALEVGGGSSEFLYPPTANKEVDVHFLQQIAASDEDAMHVVIGDGAGFHHRNGGGELPANLKIITLPAYRPKF